MVYKWILIIIVMFVKIYISNYVINNKDWENFKNIKSNMGIGDVWVCWYCSYENYKYVWECIYGFVVKYFLINIFDNRKIVWKYMSFYFLKIVVLFLYSFCI